MTTKDDGGPAFPTDHPGPDGGHTFYMGMSLRDWFAGQAPPPPDAWINDRQNSDKRNDPYYTKPRRSLEALYAEWAGRYADAMLAARKGGAE